jgi:hypothetical protein
VIPTADMSFIYLNQSVNGMGDLSGGHVAIGCNLFDRAFFYALKG